MSAVHYLTLDHVLKLHRRALAAFGGLDGIRSEQQLASAVFQPQASAFGEDAYPTIPEKAAAYGFFLAENQPFLDGNKRTAAWAMLTFLELHGYGIVMTDDEDLAVVFEDLGRDALDQGQFSIGWSHMPGAIRRATAATSQRHRTTRLDRHSCFSATTGSVCMARRAGM